MKPEDELDDGPIRCWCGAVGEFDDLFDADVYEQTCGGTGMLQCECGGDICVCHHHGEVECPGCDECCDSDDDDGY